MQNMMELNFLVGKKKFITVLDMLKGYWSIPLEDSSKHLTAFRTHRGQYQWNVLPFGLRNAAATYQRAMSKVVQTISDFACAYINNLAIFSDTWEEHLNHLEEVFKRLEHLNFSVNLGKCEFARQKVKYLGHVIGSGRHSPDKERIKATQNLQAPTTKKQLRSALRLCNFYRQVAGPRHRETVLLAYGCCLGQLDGEDNIHPIAFGSQKLDPSQQKWSTIEREAYAIIWALKRFETLLCGAKIFLLTDHNPLVFLTRAAPQCPRLQRWALAIQRHDIEAIHVKGSKVVNADALSRLYGRRPSIILSYVIACVAGIGSAFTTSFYTFNILRFFVGATIIPLSEDPYVLSLEYIGVKKRTIVIIIWSMGYILFSAICPWIAYGLRDWRLLCIITSAPLAAVPLFGKFVPESASWLLTQGRKKEAVKLLKTVARINKKEYPEEFGERCYDKNNEQDNYNTTVLDLFKTPRLRLNSLVLAIVWFVVYCCYHTNTQNASNLGTNVYDSFTYSSLVEIPALFVILFGIDWLGRRWPVAFSSLAAGLAGLVILIIPRDAIKTHLGLALIQRVTITIVYNVIMQYSAELLPTVLRGRGLAFLRLMGTLGLYLSPSIVYLSMAMPGLPLVVSGVLMLLVSAFTLTLPETLHKHLPHSIEDGEMFGKNQNVLDCPCIHKSNVDCDDEPEAATEKA
ncbi:carcinine transporter [Trichonephila clavipes]|nr:carcinine transporter [Trichonephila clavipes]